MTEHMNCVNFGPIPVCKLLEILTGTHYKNNEKIPELQTDFQK